MQEICIAMHAMQAEALHNKKLFKNYIVIYAMHNVHCSAFQTL